jgi:hypothetical protein
VIRSEYVTNIPVEVLGKVGPERVQVTGAFRPTDALIVSSSVALLPGTLIRFAQGGTSGIEGSTPNPARQGAEAGITPPGRTPGATSVPAAGTSRTRGATRPTQRPAARPATGGNEGSTPF